MSVDRDPVSFRPSAEAPIGDIEGWSMRTFATPNPLWEDASIPPEIASLLDSDSVILDGQNNLTPDMLTSELSGSPEVRLLLHEHETAGVLWQIRVPQIDEYLWQGMVKAESELADLRDVLYLLNQEALGWGEARVISSEAWEDMEVGYPDPEVSQLLGTPLRELMLSSGEVDEFRSSGASNAAFVDYEINEHDYDKMRREAENGNVNAYVDASGNLRIIVWNTVTQIGQTPRIMYLHPDHSDQKSSLTAYLMLAMHNREA